MSKRLISIKIKALRSLMQILPRPVSSGCRGFVERVPPTYQDWCDPWVADLRDRRSSALTLDPHIRA
jgi:hypothetical protein